MTFLKLINSRPANDNFLPSDQVVLEEEENDLSEEDFFSGLISFF